VIERARQEQKPNSKAMAMGLKSNKNNQNSSPWLCLNQPTTAPSQIPNQKTATAAKTPTHRCTADRKQPQ